MDAIRDDTHGQIISMTNTDEFGALLRSKARPADSKILESKGYFHSRQQNTLLSSVEFHSGVKEI